MNELSKNILTLSPGLIESGKIKIGKKGETKKSAGGSVFQLPTRQDHFTITTLARDETGNFIRDKDIHKKLGDKPTRIPIMLIFDNIESNFQSRYARYDGKTCACSGDGKIAFEGESKKEIACLCGKETFDYGGKDKCKMNGTLSVMIRDVNKFGSCWKFRTTGFNSIQGIYSSLLLIKKMTGGILAGIDLDLVLSPKTTVEPKTGKPVTIYVVGIEYAGSMKELKQAGIETLRLDSGLKKELAMLEAGTDIDILNDEPDGQDHIEEYYPEQVDAEVVTIVDTETGEIKEEAIGDTVVVEAEEKSELAEIVEAKPVKKNRPPTLLF